MICERGSTYLNNFRKESVRDRLNLSGLTLLEAAKPKIGAAAKNHRVLLPDAAAPIISCQYHQYPVVAERAELFNTYPNQKNIHPNKDRAPDLCLVDDGMTGLFFFPRYGIDNRKGLK